MKIDPRLKNIFGIGLIGSGALTVVSGVVNIIGAYQLIDPADAESLGVSRNEIVVTYIVIGLVGAVMIFLGWRLRKQAAQPSQR